MKLGSSCGRVRAYKLVGVLCSVSLMATSVHAPAQEQAPPDGPFEAGALLNIKVGNLDARATGGDLARQKPGEGGFPDAPLLGHNADEVGMRETPWKHGRWLP